VSAGIAALILLVLQIIFKRKTVTLGSTIKMMSSYVSLITVTST